MKSKRIAASRPGRWLSLALSAALVAGTFAVPWTASAEDADADDSAVYGVTAEEESGEDMTELENMAEQTELKIEKDKETATLLSLENISDAEEGTEVTVNEDGATEISDAEGLKRIAAAPDGDYILTADIDLGGENWTPIPEFTGTLDGDGYTIKNLTVRDAGGGLFSTLSGTVKNLTISGASVGPMDENGNFIHDDSKDYIEGYSWNACLAGILEEGGSAENCTVGNSEVAGSRLTGGMFGITRGDVTDCTVRDTSVTAEAKLSNPTDAWADGPYSTGGFAGDIQCGNITNCSADNVTVHGYTWVGGFAGSRVFYLSDGNGENKDVLISGCSVSGGSVTGEEDRVGGFIGTVSNGKIENCVADTSVSGQTMIGGFAGKLGSNDTVSSMVGSVVGPEIDGCRADGDVTGISAVGGFVGYAANSTTYNSCATGDVNATGIYSNWTQSCAGGFAGLIGTGTAGFENCYATGDVEGRKGVGGFTGLSMLGYDQIASGKTSRDYPYDVKNHGGIVECYATGDVTSTDQYGISSAGGFAGQLQDNGVPVDCYATGTVTAYQYAGGFAGSIIGAAAINCYASGQVSCDLEDTAGSFAGLISRPDVRTVCLTNCAASNELAGTEKTIGYENSNLSKTPTQRPGVPSDYYWPSVNPEVTVTDLTAEEMKSGEAFASLTGTYDYGSYTEKKYVSEEKTWDFGSTWTIDEGETTPYLSDADGVQAVSLSGVKAIELGGEATVTLDGYAGSVSSVGWSVSGAGEKVTSDDGSVTVRATEDGIIDVSVLLNGVKAKTLKIVAGTGGEEGMTLSFLSPAPAAGGGSEAYCVAPDASLKVKFSEAVDTDAFEADQISLRGGVSNTEKEFTYRFSENDTLLTVEPAQALEDGQTYTLTVSSSVLAESGLQLAGVNSMQFSVRSFAAPEVSTEIAGSTLTVSAAYVNNIRHYDEDLMEELPGSDSAEVYITLRSGDGAREALGGDAVTSQRTVTVPSSGGTESVSADFDITGMSGTVYIDVYTWDSESGTRAVAPAVTVTAEI